MNILRPLILVFLLVIMLSAPVWADGYHDGFYLGGYAGLAELATNKAEDSLGRFDLYNDSGELFAITLGYDLSPDTRFGPGRIELEYGQRSNSFSEAGLGSGRFPASGDLTVQSLLFNSFAVYHNESVVRPYVGLGIGAAQVSVDNLIVDGLPLLDDDTIAFAWQACIGVDLDLGSRFRLDLGYRYFSVYEPEFTEIDGRSVTFDYAAHTGMAGLVFLF